MINFEARIWQLGTNTPGMTLMAILQRKSPSLAKFHTTLISFLEKIINLHERKILKMVKKFMSMLCCRKQEQLRRPGFENSYFAYTS